MGNHAWMEKLEGHPFHEEFGKKSLTPWITLESNKVAGQVRTAGGNDNSAGNYTFVAVHEAGYV